MGCKNRASSARRRLAAATRFRSRDVVAVLRVIAQTGLAAAPERRSRAALPEAAGAVVFRIRCAWVGCAPRVKAASVRRLAGAETALFHYHRYFAGSQGPDGEPI